MIRSILFYSISCVLLLGSLELQAQETSDSLLRRTKYPGYMINLQGDTIQGYVLNLNLWSNQVITFFFQDVNPEIPGKKYRPKDLLGYKTASREYVQLKYSGIMSPYKYNFFLKEIDGPFQLFSWYYFADGSQLDGSPALLTEAKDDLLINEQDLWVQYIGKTAKGAIIDLSSVGFRMKFSKKMSRLVSDDPELSSKVLNKEKGYRYEDLEKIIREFNADD